MMTEDLTVFLDTDEFAQAATYKAGGVGAGVTVNVIFDEPDQGHFQIAGTGPAALGQASDFASFTNADTITIGATTYTIVTTRPQDDGAFVELQLEKQ